MKQVISYNIRLLRAIKGVSLWKSAEGMGVHKSALKNIEYGTSLPNAEILIRICDYYKVEDVRSFLTKKII